MPHATFSAALILAIACCPIALGQPSPTQQPPTPSIPTDKPAAPSSPAGSTPTAATPTPRPDKWWQDKHAAILDRVKQGGHQAVFLGDSITEGWGGAGKPVWETAFADAHPVNCGIGGDQTQHILARLDDGLLDALAAKNNAINTVVLLIGTNNVSNPKEQPEDIAAGVHAIVRRLQGKLPNTKIILMAIFPRGENPNSQRETITKANTHIKAQIAGDKLVFVDIGPKFLNAQGEIPKDLMPDSLHLSEAGYRIWADGIKDHISKPAPK